MKNIFIIIALIGILSISACSNPSSTPVADISNTSQSETNSTALSIRTFFGIEIGMSRDILIETEHYSEIIADSDDMLLLQYDNFNNLCTKDCSVAFQFKDNQLQNLMLTCSDDYNLLCNLLKSIYGNPSESSDAHLLWSTDDYILNIMHLDTGNNCIQFMPPVSE